MTLWLGLFRPSSSPWFLGVPCSLALASSPAAQVQVTVASEQKISESAGGFSGVLHPSDEFGDSLTSLGDFDLDGHPDLVVGAHQDDLTDQGAVWILYLCMGLSTSAVFSGDGINADTAACSACPRPGSIASQPSYSSTIQSSVRSRTCLAPGSFRSCSAALPRWGSASRVPARPSDQPPLGGSAGPGSVSSTSSPSFTTRRELKEK